MKTRFVVLALALAACASAQADLLATAAADGATVSIFNDKGPCAGDARRAEYKKIATEKKDEPPLTGCWIVAAGSRITVVWLDGDFGIIPFSSLNHEGI